MRADVHPLRERIGGGPGSALLCTLLLLAACESPDPMLKPHTWSLPPAGLDANNENLRTMLVNPNDLLAGASAEGSTGSLAGPPVQRLISGRRYPLPAAVGDVLTAPNTQQPPGGQGAGLGAGQQ